MWRILMLKKSFRDEEVAALVEQALQRSDDLFST